MQIFIKRCKNIFMMLSKPLICCLVSTISRNIARVQKIAAGLWLFLLYWNRITMKKLTTIVQSYSSLSTFLSSALGLNIACMWFSTMASKVYNPYSLCISHPHLTLHTSPSWTKGVTLQGCMQVPITMSGENCKELSNRTETTNRPQWPLHTSQKTNKTPPNRHADVAWSSTYYRSLCFSLLCLPLSFMPHTEDKDYKPTDPITAAEEVERDGSMSPAWNKTRHKTNTIHMKEIFSWSLHRQVLPVF